MPLVGYARISTSEQDMALQFDALATAGRAQVFQDTASGAKADRPGLTAALSYARKGDVLVAWKLDRLGRSASDRNGDQSGEALYRFPLAHRSDRHDHIGRQADLSHLRRSRAV